MPRQHIIKQSTHKYLEINDPEKAVGLWSHFESRQTTLKPVGETTKALGRFLNEDIARHDCWDEMKAALMAKNVDGEKRKTEARKLAEYEEEFRQEGKLPPKWLVLWRRFGSRLKYQYEFSDRPEDVQMFFGHPSVGIGCQEPHHHSSRVLFLRKAISNQLPTTNQPTTNYRYFVAVVLKPGGTKWWWSIDKTNVTWTDNTIDRLVISPNSQLEWSPIDAGVIAERVADHDICLFEMEDDPLFRAVTDAKVNPSEKFAHLSYECEFYVHDPQGPQERYYLSWSVVYNEGRKNYNAHDRCHLRSVEVLLERKKDWAHRPLSVSEKCIVNSEKFKGDESKYSSLFSLNSALDERAAAAARWAVVNNGCVVLPHNPPVELRHAVMRALVYVTFPDRPPTAVGGILRGYQLPGRMLEHYPMAVHNYGIKNMVAAMKKKSEDAAARKRKLIVDTLFERACRVILSRNEGATIHPPTTNHQLPTTISRDTVGDILEAIDARAILESAAWRWGFMEGGPLKLFKPGPTA